MLQVRSKPLVSRRRWKASCWENKCKWKLCKNEVEGSLCKRIYIEDTDGVHDQGLGKVRGDELTTECVRESSFTGKRPPLGVMGNPGTLRVVLSFSVIQFLAVFFSLCAILFHLFTKALLPLLP